MDMDNISRIFDGIGTYFVTLIFGLFVGGATGYKIGISRNISQKQKAKDNATQIQIGENYGHK